VFVVLSRWGTLTAIIFKRPKKPSCHILLEIPSKKKKYLIGNDIINLRN